MKKLTFILVTLILVSCSQEKRCSRAHKKAVRLGCVKTDSIPSPVYIPPDSSSSEKDISKQIDTFVDRIVERIYKDTCPDKKTTQNAFKSGLNNFNPEPSYDSSSRHIAKAWLENGKIKQKIIDLPIIDTFFVSTPVYSPECEEKFNWWRLAFFGLLVISFIYFIKRK